ncbi:MAG UNVERIFIED_CONTAM: lysophospholipid acyltransferase family protein [Rickettsiaceae bacterium]|jgi:lysophospholipid acyltransferase (LPLAT)-like uncharacterized protein
MKLLIKKFLKSDFAHGIITSISASYIRLVYFTSSWEYIVPPNYPKDYYMSLTNTILVSWHDKIMILPHISPFHLQKKLHALVSPHSDGKIIADSMKKLGYRIIEGSSNKNAMLAFKNIIKTLQKGDNVVITPDGPRGPRHKMKGNIIEIAKIANSSIVPFTASSTRQITLNSWDKLIFPLPFGRINVYFGEPIKCQKNTEITLDTLAKKLDDLCPY